MEEDGGLAMFNLEIEENPWILIQDSNIMLDFCVWVLKSDGLHVPPFDRHPEGNGTLRAKGLDAEVWRSWLAKVAATQDSRLGGSMDSQEQQKLIERNLSTLESLAVQNNKKIDLSAVRSSLAKSIAWQAQQSQQAAEQLGQISREATPPEVWAGEPRVGELLKELWPCYLAMLEERDIKRWRQAEQENRMTKLWRGTIKSYSTIFNKHIGKNQLWPKLQPYHSRLATLQVYQVDYPEPVEYLIPPVSVILSVANGLPDSNAYSRSVLHAAERLATSSSTYK